MTTTPLDLTTCTQTTLTVAALTRLAHSDWLTLDEIAVWIDELPTPLMLSDSDKKVALSMIRMLPSATLRTSLRLAVNS